MKFDGAKALLMAITLLGAATARADEIIYDNTTTYLGKYASVGTEYGDEVVLGGTARTLSEFFFEYYGEFTSQGDELARVRIYANDGERIGPDYVVPGTVLWQSPLIPVQQGFKTVGYTGLNVPLVDKDGNTVESITWTIQFFGLTMATTGQKDVAGLLYYDPPTVGSSFNDTWLKRADGSWVPTRTAGVTKNNFGARMEAVPEPATIALAALGCVALAARGLARRKA